VLDTDIDLEEVATIVRRHRELGEVIADLTQQRVDLEARFTALVPRGFKTEIDGRESFRRDPNRRFDLEAGVAACQALGVTLSPKWSYDPDEVKLVLKEADRIDDAMLPGTGKDRVQL
jgi:hypothetical protein